MSTKQTPLYPAPVTQTQTNPPAPLVDTLVELLFTPNSTPFSVAAHLQLSLLALARLVATPDVQAAIALVEALFRRHASIDALDALRRSLHTLDALTTLPESPSPADRDRARRAADATRRAADLVRKLILPPPTPKSKPSADPASDPATQSFIPPSTQALLDLATPSLDHSTTSSPATPSPDHSTTSSPATTSTLHFATPALCHSTTSSPATPSLCHLATSSPATSSSDPADINLDHINPNSPEYWDILLCLQTAHPDLRTKRPDLFAPRTALPASA